jgi:hypothetical protein
MALAGRRDPITRAVRKVYKKGAHMPDEVASKIEAVLLHLNESGISVAPDVAIAAHQCPRCVETFMRRRLVGPAPTHTDNHLFQLVDDERLA